ncbi:MAG: oligoendopeptidase F [Bacteroidales bacterium]|jgi:oligoendopeptidase F|nr:oligoendopeptidase F [Bacteroidales bacterium]
MKKTSLLFLAIFAVNIFSFAQEEVQDKDYYKYNWKLTDIYADWDEWQKDLEFMELQIPKYLEFKGTLGSNVERLLEFRKFSEKTSQVSSKLYVYASLGQDIDGKNSIYVTKLQQIQTAFVNLRRNTTWVETELAAIPKETIDQWISENKELAVYEHDFDSFYRQLEHILDEETQRISTYYSKALSASSKIYGSLSTADMEFHKVTLSTGEEVVASPANASKIYKTNKVQEDRKAVSEALADAYIKNKNTYSEIILGVLQNRWASAQLKGYESCLDGVLESNNIPKDVYMNLIDVASNNIASLLKYRELRKKALDLEKYYGSDGSLELVDFEKLYSYDEAVELVKICLEPMGDEYNELLANALQSGWVDVNEKEGKRGGAYSWSIYGVHPYILMNWNGTRRHVFTLAHEFGHSIHSMLTNKYQAYTYANYASMVAETASTFNEKMLLDYMIKNAKSNNEKITLLVQAIDNISGTFYRQAQFAEFEYNLYSKIEKDEPLNADIMANLYDEIDEKYNGTIMEKSENSAYSWPRIHHFFNYNYYVYNYAVSFSASSSLFNQIKQADSEEEAKLAHKRYLTLLKSGGNDYPVDLLKKAGVDLNTKEPYLAVVKRMEELVNQLEIALKEAGKI